MTPKQRRAAELLGRGHSQLEVGRMVDRSERTIRNWLRDVDGFREAAQAAQRRVAECEGAEGGPQSLSPRAGFGSADRLAAIRTSLGRVPR